MIDFWLVLLLRFWCCSCVWKIGWLCVIVCLVCFLVGWKWCVLCLFFLECVCVDLFVLCVVVCCIVFCEGGCIGLGVCCVVIDFLIWVVFWWCFCWFVLLVRCFWLDWFGSWEIWCGFLGVVFFLVLVLYLKFFWFVCWYGCMFWWVLWNLVVYLCMNVNSVCCIWFVVIGGLCWGSGCLVKWFLWVCCIVGRLIVFGCIFGLSFCLWCIVCCCLDGLFWCLLLLVGWSLLCWGCWSWFSDVVCWNGRIVWFIFGVGWCLSIWMYCCLLVFMFFWLCIVVWWFCFCGCILGSFLCVSFWCFFIIVWVFWCWGYVWLFVVVWLVFLVFFLCCWWLGCWFLCVLRLMMGWCWCEWFCVGVMWSVLGCWLCGCWSGCWLWLVCCSVVLLCLFCRCCVCWVCWGIFCLMCDSCWGLLVCLWLGSWVGLWIGLVYVMCWWGWCCFLCRCMDVLLLVVVIWFCGFDLNGFLWWGCMNVVICFWLVCIGMVFLRCFLGCWLVLGLDGWCGWYRMFFWWFLWGCVCFLWGSCVLCMDVWCWWCCIFGMYFDWLWLLVFGCWLWLLGLNLCRLLWCWLLYWWYWGLMLWGRCWCCWWSVYMYWLCVWLFVYGVLVCVEFCFVCIVCCRCRELSCWGSFRWIWCFCWLVFLWVWCCWWSCYWEGKGVLMWRILCWVCLFWFFEFLVKNWLGVFCWVCGLGLSGVFSLKGGFFGLVLNEIIILCCELLMIVGCDGVVK